MKKEMSQSMKLSAKMDMLRRVPFDIIRNKTVFKNHNLVEGAELVFVDNPELFRSMTTIDRYGLSKRELIMLPGHEVFSYDYESIPADTTVMVPVLNDVPGENPVTKEELMNIVTTLGLNVASVDYFELYCRRDVIDIPEDLNILYVDNILDLERLNYSGLTKGTIFEKGVEDLFDRWCESNWQSVKKIGSLIKKGEKVLVIPGREAVSLLNTEHYIYVDGRIVKEPAVTLIKHNWGASLGRVNS